MTDSLRRKNTSEERRGGGDEMTKMIMPIPPVSGARNCRVVGEHTVGEGGRKEGREERWRG